MRVIAVSIVLFALVIVPVFASEVKRAPVLSGASIKIPEIKAKENSSRLNIEVSQLTVLGNQAIVHLEWQDKQARMHMFAFATIGEGATGKIRTYGIMHGQQDGWLTAFYKGKDFPLKLHATPIGSAGQADAIVETENGIIRAREDETFSYAPINSQDISSLFDFLDVAIPKIIASNKGLSEVPLSDHVYGLLTDPRYPHRWFMSQKWNMKP